MQARQPGLPAAFASVVCGIDASPQSEEALRQAAVLAADDARIWGVSVWDPGAAVHAGIHASEVMADLRKQSVSALKDAQDEIPDLKPVLVRGGDVAGLLGAVTNFEADLVSVASHGTSRPAGILFGSVATAIAHHAPCSTLIAREAAMFPGLILHAGDGSPESLDAARLAGTIAARYDSNVASLHVGDELDRVRELAEESVALIEQSGREPATEVRQGSPHRMIVQRANELGAGLIVIGSRGRTGLKSLGSVSERVAHHAPCSVLIVRRPAHPSTDKLHDQTAPGP